MTLVPRRSRSALLLALAAGWSLEAAAQLPAAPQVVLDSKPATQQQTQPVPSAAPSSSAPAITLQSSPGAAAPAPAASPAPVIRPAAGPSLPSTTVTIQSNPNAPAPAAAAAPVALPAPVAVPKASSAEPQPVVTTATLDGIGTTIFGEQEAPIGLYITPWKDDYAERGLDRPARLLDEAMEPIDPATFRRQIEYYETITEFRRKQRGEAK